VRRAHAAAVLLVLSLIIAALSIGSVRLDSATSDEPAYIAAGMIKLQHGRLDFFRDQPPLMNSVSALPLVVAGYSMPPIWEVDGPHWGIGKRFLYMSGFDGNRMLLLARLPTIALFLGLCLAMYLFVARHTGSRMWGVAAFALAGFCPNLMAHGRLATVDLAVTFFIFSASALLIELIERPRPGVAIALGVFSAASILTKTSANILGPFALAVVGFAWFTRRITDRRRVLAMIAVALLVAVVVFEAVILSLGSAAYMKSSFPGVPRLAVPFAEYMENLRVIRDWYAGGSKQPQFLLGRFSEGSWPQYYPIAILLKTTIPALLLMVAALIVAIRRRAIPFPVAMSLLFVAMFLGVAAAGELALGLRYVLPVYPFLYAATMIVIGKAAAPRGGATSSRRLLVFIAVVLILHTAENIRAYPSYLSYFNQFIGSHRNADRFLIDSNLDWGQDLRRLNLWAKENRVGAMAIHYFGGGIPEYDLEARVIGGYGPGRAPLPKGWFALSRHMYRVSFNPKISRMNYDDYLAQSGAQYVTTAGGSINVYRIP
jgi:4-amino-4-deoxy-L-arabinose transferase-like glycosyltransferase